MNERYAIEVVAGYYDMGELKRKRIVSARSLSELASLLEHLQGAQVIRTRLYEIAEDGGEGRSLPLGERVKDEDDEFVEAYDDVGAELDSIYGLVDGLVALASERMSPAADAIREKVREKIANVRVRVGA